MIYDEVVRNMYELEKKKFSEKMQYSEKEFLNLFKFDTLSSHYMFDGKVQSFCIMNKTKNSHYEDDFAWLSDFKNKDEKNYYEFCSECECNNIYYIDDVCSNIRNGLYFALKEVKNVLPKWIVFHGRVVNNAYNKIENQLHKFQYNTIYYTIIENWYKNEPFMLIIMKK